MSDSPNDTTPPVLGQHVDASHTMLTLHGAAAYDLRHRRIRIDDEWMFVQAQSLGWLTVIRGSRGPDTRYTDPKAHVSGTPVTID